MIDVVRFKGVYPELGFSKIYNFEEFNIKEGSERKFFEDKKVDIILSPEKGSTKDNLHFRNAGLNQVLCKLAKKNNIALGFSFNEILNASNLQDVLGRMKQNVKLCRKYKVKMVFASFAKDKFEMRGAYDLLSFARILGMEPGEAKQALNFKK